MAVVYDGLYKFPTDLGDLAFLKVTSDSSRSTLTTSEIATFLATWVPSQGSVLTYWNKLGVVHTADYINLSAFTTYLGYSCELLYTSGYYYMLVGGRNGGTFQTYGASYNFIRVPITIIVQCSDGYMLALANTGEQDDLMSVTIPTQDAAGYFAYSGTNTVGFGVSFSPYNSLMQIAVNDYFSHNPPVPFIVPETDPYDTAGISESGGGEGDFSDSGDDVDIPQLPPDFASDSKFITLFNPSLAQLQSLASYMWSSAFDLDSFKKLFANPMDCILGLSIVPVAVPNGGTKVVTVGNISTGVSMTVADTQFVEVDCGTLNINEYWGAYLDYEPFTKAEIYLPYIGTHAISVDDIMGKSVHVVYHVDILSGACAAYVEVNGTVLYQFIGQCAASIPITGNDFTNMINGVLSIAGAIGSMVATGGASAPLAAGAIASTAVNSMKPNIEKSGSMSGTGGLMAVQTPYIILTRPRQALPAHQNKYLGYPAFINVSMNDLEGYTEVESVHLENMSATSTEVAEIETILKSGVIF